MTILLLGSGGREHAFAWKMIQSPLCDKLFVAPGNAGTASIANNVDISPTDFDAVKALVLEEKVEMVVVGPEDPLVKGIYDFFKNDEDLKDIPVIGPSKLGATLEGSKEFAKEFLMKHNIPTAAYDSFTAETVEKGCDFLETLQSPYVLKADGLAAGKGVLIIQDLAEAQEELRKANEETKDEFLRNQEGVKKSQEEVKKAQGEFRKAQEQTKNEFLQSQEVAKKTQEEVQKAKEKLRKAQEEIKKARKK